MPYTTKELVRLAVARNLDEVEGTAASLNDDAIDDAIAEAQSRVDGKLADLYKVPFDEPAPALVRNVTRDIAAYLCDLTFREVRDYSSNLNPTLLRYQDALKLLDEIAAGKVALPDVPGATSPTGEVVQVINPNCVTFNECEFDIGFRPIVWF